MRELFIPLNANYPDDPRVMELPLAAVGLHVSAMCLAKRLLTDGEVTRAHLRRLASSETDPDALIEELVRVGLIRSVSVTDSVTDPLRSPSDRYRIAGWAERHPKASDLTISAEESTRMNHERWHVKRGVFKDDCALCNDANPQVTPSRSAHGPGRESVHGPGPESRPLPETDSSETETETETTVRVSPFDKFWAAYPKKRGKKDAIPAFKRVVAAGADPAEIIAGAHQYAERVKRDGTEEKFVKYPQGWLNDERWTERLDGPATDVHGQDYDTNTGVFGASGMTWEQIEREEADTERQRIAHIAAQEAKAATR